MESILRSSGAKKPNLEIEDQSMQAAKASNVKWLKARPAELKSAVLLLGGTSLAHFRIRCAQAIMRRDLLPSLWSQVGIVTSHNVVITIPVDSLSDVSRVPEANGVEIVPVSTFDDSTDFPNIALLRFTPSMASLLKTVEAVTPHREQFSIPTLLVRWLTYIWAVGEERNPLSEGIGVPSARWLESVFAEAEIELAPGLASGASCPEAIWQAAKWWHEFYGTGSKPENSLGRKDTITPTGIYIARQHAAAIRGPRDKADGSPTDQTRGVSQEFNPMRR
jgi:hypothetical protein